MDVFPGSNTQLASALAQSVQFITERLGKAQVSMVLGSGLGNFWKRLGNCESIPYGEIPYMSAPDVPGHSGRLYYGEVGGMKIYCWGGRLHLYEGYECYQTAIIAHISALLGCHTMLLTNGAGGGMKGMKPGCAMIIRDHINLEGFNTLDSYYHSLYSQANFDPQELYSPELCAIAKEIGEREQFLPIYEGTYFCCSGPTFETQYETRSYIKLGGDCFGMSTIPEVLAARSYGLRVLGMSLVTNLATCLLDEELSHIYVLAQSDQAANAIEQLFCKILERIATLQPGPVFDPAKVTIRPETWHGLHNRHRQVRFSGSEMRETVQWVQKLNNGTKGADIAICCNGMDMGHLEGKREVLMADLPNFPAFSRAGRLGTMAFGALNGQQVAVLGSPTEEGFDPFESLFLAKLLKEMGILHIHYRFPAINIPPSEAIYMQDYYSLTSQCLPSFLFTSSQPTRISALGTANVVAWPGPGLPSPAEREMGRKLGGDYVTIADMSILNAAGQVGLLHSGSIAAKGSRVDLREVLERLSGLGRAEEAAEVPLALQDGARLPVKVMTLFSLRKWRNWPGLLRLLGLLSSL